MDVATQTALITGVVTLLGGGGVFGGIAWIFRNLLNNKDGQLLDLKAQVDRLNAELEKERERRSVEVRQLLIEKVEEAKESQEIARAYIQLREREDG